MPLMTSLTTQPVPADFVSADPYWGYEDIGIFFVLLAGLATAFRLAVRLHIVPATQLANPTWTSQCAIVLFLVLALYLVLKLRYHQPVIQALGWAFPALRYAAAALLIGPAFAVGVMLATRFRHQVVSSIPVAGLLVLGLFLGPVLEESLFRGCLLLVLARTFGNVLDVIVTALLFALLHGPASLAHWFWFTATGVAYGWLRVASRTTTAAFFMHAAYNLTLFLVSTV